MDKSEIYSLGKLRFGSEKMNSNNEIAIDSERLLRFQQTELLVESLSLVIKRSIQTKDILSLLEICSLVSCSARPALNSAAGSSTLRLLASHLSN